jgi:hypothetical protein
VFTKTTQASRERERAIYQNSMDPSVWIINLFSNQDDQKAFYGDSYEIEQPEQLLDNMNADENEDNDHTENLGGDEQLDLGSDDDDDADDTSDEADDEEIIAPRFDDDDNLDVKELDDDDDDIAGEDDLNNTKNNGTDEIADGIQNKRAKTTKTVKTAKTTKTVKTTKTTKKTAQPSKVKKFNTPIQNSTTASTASISSSTNKRAAGTCHPAKKPGQSKRPKQEK